MSLFRWYILLMQCSGNWHRSVGEDSVIAYINHYFFLWIYYSILKNNCTKILRYHYIENSLIWSTKYLKIWKTVLCHPVNTHSVYYISKFWAMTLRSYWHNQQTRVQLILIDVSSSEYSECCNYYRFVFKIPFNWIQNITFKLTWE